MSQKKKKPKRVVLGEGVAVIIGVNKLVALSGKNLKKKQIEDSGEKDSSDSGDSMSRKRHKMTMLLKIIRKNVGELIMASGCSCCQNTEEWEKRKKILGYVLRFPKFKDGSGYDFSQKKATL